MPNCHASPAIYADMALLPIGTKIATVNNGSRDVFVKWGLQRGITALFLLTSLEYLTLT
ncbi:MAG: hypothetical protein OXN25_07355 [Candidatus Poribacteria bacterium]|nr:hypothetical protein [Candidatus Poribacteria bacterium]